MSNNKVSVARKVCVPAYIPVGSDNFISGISISENEGEKSREVIILQLTHSSPEGRQTPLLPEILEEGRVELLLEWVNLAV